MTLQTFATHARRGLELATRDNGSKFYRRRADAPAWLADLCQTTHGGHLPDDHHYEMLADVLSSMSELDEDEDWQEVSTERLDSLVPIYTAELTDWLGSHVERSFYVDEAVNDYGHSDSGVIGDIQRGYFAELEEVAGAIVGWWQQHAENVDEVAEIEVAAD